MFTGIIEHNAEVTSITNDQDIITMSIARPNGWNLTHGQSIAVNGACLTVTHFSDTEFRVEMMPETLARTTFGEQPPARVNLERAMAANGRLEGHIVQGHVDQVSQVKKIVQSEQWRTLHISYPNNKSPLLVDKGSITIDGTSLTIVEVQKDWFSVSIIPHTLDNTTLGELSEGDFVNIEYDILGKFVQKNLQY